MSNDMIFSFLKRTAAGAVALGLLGCLGVTAASASSFSLLPGSGSLTAAPGDTVGWGYSIVNDTAFYLVPTNLSLSGVTYGSLTDIFDYPVVAPVTTVSLGYQYAFPGGAGASIGLIEYAVPFDVPPGLDQSGTATVQYQLFDANPDTDPNALAVGGVQSFDAVGYDVTAAAVGTPEPGTWVLVVGGGMAMGWVQARRRREVSAG